jgi:hypothetical protein
MKCKNYYALSETEIDVSIQAMREWLFEFQHSEKAGQVFFALTVALNAKDLKRDIENDEFLKLVVDTVC